MTLIGTSLVDLIVILADAVRVCVSHLRSGRISDSEHPREPSKVFAPAGLVATAEEKRIEQMWAQHRTETPEPPAVLAGRE